LFYLVDHLNDPLHVGAELGLLLGELVEGSRHMLGALAEVLGCVSGAFIFLSQHLGRHPRPFRVVPHLLSSLPDVFRETPLIFGFCPRLFRVCTVRLGLFTTHFGLLTLCFRVLAGWLIAVHAALLTPDTTPNRFNQDSRIPLCS
jgi:hypothetical protein